MPAAIRHGVFGMARMTGTFGGRFLSIIDVGTEAATDTINCFGVTCSLISRITSSTTWGFTPITMMSAPLAASTLLVPTFTFNFVDNALARSSWATVAHVDFAESRPSFSRACRMIPPIFPAPRNATFFPVRSLAMGTYDFPFLISQSHDKERRRAKHFTEPRLPDDALPNSMLCSRFRLSRAWPSNSAMIAPWLDWPPAPEDHPDVAAPLYAARSCR